VQWQTKELLIALSLSSILGVIVKLYDNGMFQLTTLNKTDIEKIKETFSKEFGNDPEKARAWRFTFSRYLRGELLKLFKNTVSARRYQREERKLAALDKQKLTSEERIVKKQVRRSFFLRAQFWTLLGGMLLYVLLVIFTY
jgi:phytoene dehydrogenase-like protein